MYVYEIYVLNFFKIDFDIHNLMGCGEDVQRHIKKTELLPDMAG